MMIKAMFLLIIATLCFAVWVEGDSSHIGAGAGAEGMFSVGVPPDPPTFPDVRPILHSNYRYISPEGGSFSLYVNGKIYSQSPLPYMLFPDSAENISSFLIDTTSLDSLSNTLITRWFIDSDPFGNDSILVEQFLTPYENADTALVRIRIKIHNYSGGSPQIGMLLFMDLLGDTLGITLPGGSIIHESVIFPDSLVSPSFPTYWEFFYAAGEMAYFDLSSPPNTPPDRLGYADLHDFLGLFWNPVIRMSWVLDAASIMWWLPVSVPPDGWIEYQTSIGVLVDTLAGAIAESPELPQSIALSAFPNPFNSAVTIFVETLHATSLRIEIFDIAGRRVAQLPSPSVPLPAGEGRNSFSLWEKVSEGRMRAEFIWQPEKSLGSGVYLVRAKIGDESVTKRVVYLR